MTNDQVNSLTVSDPSDVLLTLLYAPGKSGEHGEPIDGITRLQKLVFLFQEEKLEGILKDIGEYEYNPDQYGPYSRQLINELEELKSAGIIKTDKLEYTFTDDSDDPGDFDADIDLPWQTQTIESSRYYLSEPLGVQIGQELWGSLSEKQREQIKKFKTFFNSITLRQLLLYTYEKHSDYTGESVIRDELDFS